MSPVEPATASGPESVVVDPVLLGRRRSSISVPNLRVLESLPSPSPSSSDEAAAVGALIPTASTATNNFRPNYLKSRSATMIDRIPTQIESNAVRSRAGAFLLGLVERARTPPALGYLEPTSASLGTGATMDRKDEPPATREEHPTAPPPGALAHRRRNMTSSDGAPGLLQRVRRKPTVYQALEDDAETASSSDVAVVPSMQQLTRELAHHKKDATTQIRVLSSIMRRLHYAELTGGHTRLCEELVDEGILGLVVGAMREFRFDTELQLVAITVLTFLADVAELHAFSLGELDLEPLLQKIISVHVSEEQLLMMGSALHHSIVEARRNTSVRRLHRLREAKLEKTRAAKFARDLAAEIQAARSRSPSRCEPRGSFRAQSAPMVPEHALRPLRSLGRLRSSLEADLGTPPVLSATFQLTRRCARSAGAGAGGGAGGGRRRLPPAIPPLAPNNNGGFADNGNEEDGDDDDDDEDAEAATRPMTSPMPLSPPMPLSLVVPASRSPSSGWRRPSRSPGSSSLSRTPTALTVAAYTSTPTLVAASPLSDRMMQQQQQPPRKAQSAIGARRRRRQLPVHGGTKSLSSCGQKPSPGARATAQSTPPREELEQQHEESEQHGALPSADGDLDPDRPADTTTITTIMTPPRVDEEEAVAADDQPRQRQNGNNAADGEANDEEEDESYYGDEAFDDDDDGGGGVQADDGQDDPDERERDDGRDPNDDGDGDDAKEPASLTVAPIEGQHEIDSARLNAVASDCELLELVVATGEIAEEDHGNDVVLAPATSDSSLLELLEHAPDEAFATARTTISGPISDELLRILTSVDVEHPLTTTTTTDPTVSIPAAADPPRRQRTSSSSTPTRSLVAGSWQPPSTIVRPVNRRIIDKTAQEHRRQRRRRQQQPQQQLERTRDEAPAGPLPAELTAILSQIDNNDSSRPMPAEEAKAQPTTTVTATTAAAAVETSETSEPTTTTAAAVRALYARGLAYHKAEALDEAIACYESAIRLQQRDPEAREFASLYINLGSAWMARGQAEAALGVFERALRVQPRNPKAGFNVGLALLHLGRRDEATVAFRRVLELDPHHLRASAALRQCLWSSATATATTSTTTNPAITTRANEVPEQDR